MGSERFCMACAREREKKKKKEKERENDREREREREHEHVVSLGRCDNLWRVPILPGANRLVAEGAFCASLYWGLTRMSDVQEK